MPFCIAALISLAMSVCVCATPPFLPISTSKCERYSVIMSPDRTDGEILTIQEPTNDAEIVSDGEDERNTGENSVCVE